MKLNYNHNGETNKIEFAADQTTSKPRAAIYHNGQTWYVPRVPADSSNASNFTFWHNGEHLALSSGAGTAAVFNDGVYEFYDSNSNLLFSLSGLRSDLGNLSISDNLIFSSGLNDNIGSIDANIVTLNANALSENDAVSIGGDFGYKLALGNDVTKLVTALAYSKTKRRINVTVTTAGYAINATGDIVYKPLGSLGDCKVSLPSGVTLNANTLPTFFASDGLVIKILSVDAFGTTSDYENTTTITLNDTTNHIGVYLMLDEIAFDGINEGIKWVDRHFEKINDSTIAYFTAADDIFGRYQIPGTIVGDVVDYQQQINFVHYYAGRKKLQRYTISGLTNLPADDENFDTTIKQHISLPTSWTGGETSFIKIEDTTFLPTSGTVTLTYLMNDENILISLTGPENCGVTFETITQIV